MESLAQLPSLLCVLGTADSCCESLSVCMAVQAEAEASERAERARLAALAEEVRRFNELKLMQLSETERQER